MSKLSAGWGLRARRTVSLGTPIAVGLLVTNVMSMIEAAMIAPLGRNALAATGLGGYLFLFAGSIFFGLGSGVQSLTAKREAGSAAGSTAEPLHTALVLALAVAPGWALLHFMLGPELLTLAAGDDSEVTRLAQEYYRWRCPGIVAFAVNFAFLGHFNGKSQPLRFLKVSLVMLGANALLNWLLITGHAGFPALGVKGAALASTLAFCVGSVVYLASAWITDRQRGLLSGLPSRQRLHELLAVAAPVALEKVLWFGGFTVNMGIIARCGSAALAAGHLLTTLVLVPRLMMMALGMVSVTLVGEAVASRDALAVRRAGWETSQVAAAAMVASGVLFGLLNRPALMLFTTDPELLVVAATPALIMAVAIWIDAAGMVLEQALLPLGEARRVLAYNVALQWGVLLPAAWLAGPAFGYGLTGVWLAQVGYRLCHSAVFSLRWHVATAPVSAAYPQPLAAGAAP